MNKTPETTFEFVQKWVKKAAELFRECKEFEFAALWSDALQHLEYQHARIAELEQQLAELSKDKARLDGLIKIMSTDNGDYFCFEPDGDGWSLTLNDDISMSSVSVGRSQIDAIDAAIAKEQDHAA